MESNYYLGVGVKSKQLKTKEKLEHTFNKVCALKSTSVGAPVVGFNSSGGDTHRMQVPFSNVFVAFFMSPEMCEHRHGNEMEFLCNLTGVPTILQARDGLSGTPPAPLHTPESSSTPPGFSGSFLGDDDGILLTEDEFLDDDLI
jgi:hypothetical protein